MVESTSFKNQLLNIFISQTKKELPWNQERDGVLLYINYEHSLSKHSYATGIEGNTYVFTFNINPTEITPIYQLPT